MRLEAYSNSDIQKFKNLLLQMERHRITVPEALHLMELRLNSSRIEAVRETGRRAERRHRPKPPTSPCPDCGKPMTLTIADDAEPELAVWVCKGCGRSVFEGKTFAAYLEQP